MLERKSIKLIKPRLQSLFPYVVISFLSLLAVFPILKLWRAYWRVPFYYNGDALFYEMLFKGVIENGWYLNNKNLGMPFGGTLYDFPVPDTFNLLLIKLAACFTSDHHLIFNLFYIMTYPLTAIISLYVLRQFNLSFFPALVGSMLYSFTTYHLNRAEGHLFYTTYYVVPLMVLVILWAGAASGNGNDGDQQRLRLSLRNRKFIFSLVVCALIASTGGVYYAFFACYLLLVVGVVRAIALKQVRHLLLPGVLTAVIFAVMIINLSPNIIYQRENGKSEVALRLHPESETYALKIAQLVLPMSGHRIGALARLKDRYNQAPLVTENDDSSLGAVGSIGFITLLGWLVCNAFKIGRREEESTSNLWGQLSVLNISALLLGVIGGFSSLFSLLISPQIRAYNRISVYIAFFALFASALLLESAKQRFFQSYRMRAVFGLLAILLTIAGLYDQSGRRFVPSYQYVKYFFDSDVDFIRRIEASVPAGAMIFQLPVKRFPETPPIERMWDYDMVRGYVNSKQLRWSYGAMRGRESDSWQTSIASLPLPEMIETITLAQFEGIYIDRYAYPDNAAQLESDLAALLETQPFASNEGRLSFFNLSAYRKKLQEKYPAPELTLREEKARYPLIANWVGGFSEQESSSEEVWRWCGPSGDLILNNTAPYQRRITVEMSLETAKEGDVYIESPFFKEQLNTYPGRKTFSKTFDVPPGKHWLNFSSNAKKAHAPNDPRTLVFRLINFNLKSG
jgi:hypothetical protein